MRALVVRYRKLGDSIMASPILRALGERGDVFAVGETAYRRAFSDSTGFIGLSRAEPSRWELVRAGIAARRFRCCTALVLRFNRRASIVARFAGCQRRIGGIRSGPDFLAGLTQNAYDSETWPLSHQVEKYYAVAEAAFGPLPRYPTSYPAVPAADLPRGYVAVHLDNGGSNLGWPDDRFVCVIADLRARGLPVVATGGNTAFPRARAAADVDLVGSTNLDTLASVFAGARGVVGLDGGGPRMAAAVGTPVVVLSLGDRWTFHQAAPWMSPGVVIEPTEQEDGFRSLGPDRVVAALESLLDKP